MKIITYNVNGIRSAMNKGFIDFLKTENPDVVCLQELKANKEDINQEAFAELGYHHFWYSAQKKGYSGVAILSKQKPDEVIYGCGHELFDFEGRVIQAIFGDTTIFSCYFPSGTTGDKRQDVKYQFLDYFYDYIGKFISTSSMNDTLTGSVSNQKLIVCGDYNICHKEIDIHDPKGNKNSSGFLPEERAWMDKWFASGMIDTLRHLNPEPHLYTWWSLRAGSRARNKGWRIDYISVSENLSDTIKASGIYSQAVHSDHCGSYLVLE